MAKNLIIAIIMTIAFIQVNAQLLIDDFTTGSLSQKNISTVGEQKFDQNGSSIINGKRTTIVRIRQNPEKQFFQAKISDGKLVASIGYSIIGVLELQYGWGTTTKLNKDLSSYKNIHIEYEGKSNFGRVYIDMFSNGPNRAYWRGKGNMDNFQGSIASNGSNRSFTLKVPLKDFTNAQDNTSVPNKFTINDVDNFKFHFITQSKPGINFVVKKIWIE